LGALPADQPDTPSTSLARGLPNYLMNVLIRVESAKRAGNVMFPARFALRT
jgi:hypothetical protein